MPRQIEDLREKLFETLDGLTSKSNPMDLDRAQAVADIAQVIINSAKVEVDYLRLRGETYNGTGFIPDTPKVTAPVPPGTPRLVKGSASE